jgi:hypothetical protein
MNISRVEVFDVVIVGSASGGWARSASLKPDSVASQAATKDADYREHVRLLCRIEG